MTTNYEQGSTSPPEDGSGDSAEAKERAQQVAGSAAEQGQHVAGVAQEHAQKIAGEAKDQVRGLMGEATTQIEEQSRTQKAKLAEVLRDFGEDLERMSGSDEADGSHGASTGTAQQLVQQVAHQAHDLAGRLEDREPQELLDDVRRFARQKPGAFILGALVAGVVAGRLTRGTKAAKDEGEDTSSTTWPGTGSPSRGVGAGGTPAATPAASGLDATSLPGTNAPGGTAPGAPR